MAAGVHGMIGLWSTIGKFFFGWLCDKIKPAYACAFGTALQIAGTVLLMNMGSNSSSAYVWLYIFLFGVGVGNWLPTFSMLVSTNFGLLAYGTIFGMLGLSQSLGASIAPFLTGFMYNATGHQPGICRPGTLIRRLHREHPVRLPSQGLMQSCWKMREITGSEFTRSELRQRLVRGSLRNNPCSPICESTSLRVPGVLQRGLSEIPRDDPVRRGFQIQKTILPTTSTLPAIPGFGGFQTSIRLYACLSWPANPH